MNVKTQTSSKYPTNSAKINPSSLVHFLFADHFFHCGYSYYQEWKPECINLSVLAAQERRLCCVHYSQIDFPICTCIVDQNGDSPVLNSRQPSDPLRSPHSPHTSLSWHHRPPLQVGELWCRVSLAAGPSPGCPPPCPSWQREAICSTPWTCRGTCSGTPTTRSGLSGWVAGRCRDFFWRKKTWNFWIFEIRDKTESPLDGEGSRRINQYCMWDVFLKPHQQVRDLWSLSEVQSRLQEAEQRERSPTRSETPFFEKRRIRCNKLAKYYNCYEIRIVLC